MMKKFIIILLLFISMLSVSVSAQATNYKQPVFKPVKTHFTIHNIKGLIDRGGDINHYDGFKGLSQNLLFAAITKQPANYLNIVKFLLDQGINVHIRDHYGNNLLVYIIRDPNIRHKKTLLSLLIKHGANINNRDAVGSTPLMLAINANMDFPFIQTLVHLGADVHALDNRGNSTLNYALENSFLSVPLVRFLVNHGVDVNHIGDRGMTPLMILATHHNPNNYTLIKYLVGKKAQLNKVNKKGMTALMYACLTRNINDFKIVKYLLRKGAITLDRNLNGDTPLLIAIKNSTPHDRQVIEILLQHHSDVNLPAESGYSPLMLAIFNQYMTFDTIKMLIDYGADVNYYNFSNQSVLELTLLKYRFDQIDIVKYLTLKGARIDNRIINLLKGTIKDRKILEFFHTYYYVDIFIDPNEREIPKTEVVSEYEFSHN